MILSSTVQKRCLALNYITRVGQTYKPRPLVELWIRSMLYLYGRIVIVWVLIINECVVVSELQYLHYSSPDYLLPRDYL